MKQYLRLKDNDNNINDNKKIKSKMINYEIERNQKSKIFIHIPEELHQSYLIIWKIHMNINLQEFSSQKQFKSKFLQN